MVPEFSSFDWSRFSGRHHKEQCHQATSRDLVFPADQPEALKANLLFTIEHVYLAFKGAKRLLDLAISH